MLLWSYDALEEKDVVRILFRFGKEVRNFRAK